MDYKAIHDLLDKYFEGETSLEEEKELAEFFQQKELSQEFQSFRPWFDYLKQEKGLASAARYSNAPWLQVQPKSQKPYFKIIRHLGKVAAAMLLAWAAFYFSPMNNKEKQTAAIDWSKYEPANAEEAFRLTKKALLRTSAELNRGAALAVKEVTKVKRK